MYEIELCQAIFNLMQDSTDISSNIEDIKQYLFADSDINIQNLDRVEEKFYNSLLLLLRNMHDDLWESQEHTLVVYDIIREKLDQYTIAPTPYIKDKFYT